MAKGDEWIDACKRGMQTKEKRERIVPHIIVANRSNALNMRDAESMRYMCIRQTFTSETRHVVMEQDWMMVCGESTLHRVRCFLKERKKVHAGVFIFVP